MHVRLRWVLWTVLVFLSSSFVVSGCTWHMQTTGIQQATRSQSSPGLDSLNIMTGMSVERDFGPLTLLIGVDQQLTQVDIDVRLDDRLMTQCTLTQDVNTRILDLVNGDVALRGSLAVRFAYPPGRSFLIGDFKVVVRQTEFPFRGDIVAWQWLEAPILARRTVWITPELRVESDILLDVTQSVQIRFLAGTQVIHTVTLSQGANSAIVDKAFAVGTVRIESGMSLQLQPATFTQDGEVYLKGSFASSNLPKVDYAGAIATWSYIQPQQTRRGDE